MTLRLTEQAHPQTQAIDRVEPEQMVACLQAADRDLFVANSLSQSLANQHFQKQLSLAQAKISACLAHPYGRVIMGGAGTSGRLALIAAEQSKQPRVQGLLAGGVDAFFKAKENVEDLPQIGIDDLEAVLPHNGPCVYIGISCGLSAAYVAGQMHRSMQQPNSFTILLGFNPASDANTRELPGLQTSMHQLVAQLQAQPEKGLLLNPTIGPEPITGSTRMKGGSATKIILDSLLHQQPLQIPPLLKLQDQVYDCLRQQCDIFEVIGKVLAQSGKLVYWTQNESALFTLLDASECPPTFGADPDQVWSYCNRGDVLKDFCAQEFLYPNFQPPKHVPHLILCTPDISHQAFEALRQSWREHGNIHVLKLQCPLELWHAKVQGTQGLTQKWLLNALTTLGFVRAGKIYGNCMIDLRISNVKLWDRATRIISEIAQISTQQADYQMRAILKSYNSQDYSEQDMITMARKLPLVPLAILTAKRGLTLGQAQNLLQKEPRLVKAIQTN